MKLTDPTFEKVKSPLLSSYKIVAFKIKRCFRRFNAHHWIFHYFSQIFYVSHVTRNFVIGNVVPFYSISNVEISLPAPRYSGEDTHNAHGSALKSN